MTTITFRHVDDAAFERLKRAAKAHDRSLEAEARMRVLGDRMSRPEVVERLRAFRPPTGPDYKGSVALIRAIRDGAALAAKLVLEKADMISRSTWP